MLLYFQFPSKVCIMIISTLKWWNIQFKFSNMIIITYRSWRWASVAVVLSWTTRCRLFDHFAVQHVLIY